MGIGGDFAFGIRYGTLDAGAAAAGQGSEEHRHFPSARRLVLSWHQDQSGKWVAGAEDERRWEVFCRECGDTDGPAEAQSEAVQRLPRPLPQ